MQDTTMKKTPLWQLVLRGMAFLLILVLLLMTASYMLAPKDNTKGSGITNPNAHGFFSEPEDSIDVAVIGNSDAYSGFSPMELWNEYGITSYVSGEGRQVPAGSLAMLKRILTCQTPKVVILETDGVFTKTDFSQDVVNLFNSTMGNQFSIFQYHNRWKSVKPPELFQAPFYTSHCVSKGQMLSNKVKGYMGEEYMIETRKVAQIPASSRIAMNEMINICKENGITLILLEIPSKSSWTYERHNAIEAYAAEKGLTFIDLNLDRDSFDFDWTTDSRDGGNHLNNCGARKVTLHLGKYLQETFSLEDHREDAAFAAWHEDYASYKEQIKI